MHPGSFELSEQQTLVVSLQSQHGGQKKEKSKLSRSDIMFPLKHCKKKVRCDLVEDMSKLKKVTFIFGKKKFWASHKTGVITETRNNKEF